jgi:hypothetical protein
MIALVDADRFLTALVGALFGAAGWLVVGLYIQRTQHERQARNAARAVYFELANDLVDVDIAVRHGVFGQLRRATFDRLLPELATWLDAMELQTIARAYSSHAGFDQLQRESHVPPPVKAALLQRILAEHVAAADLLRRRAFSAHDAARLAAESPIAAAAATAVPQRGVARG